MDDEAETYKMWRVRSVHHISGFNLFPQCSRSTRPLVSSYLAYPVYFFVIF